MGYSDWESRCWGAAVQHAPGLGFHFIQCKLSREGLGFVVLGRFFFVRAKHRWNLVLLPAFVLHMEMVIFFCGACVCGEGPALPSSQRRGTIPDILLLKMPNSEIFQTMFSKLKLVLILQGSGAHSGYSQTHTPHIRFTQRFTHTHRELCPSKNLLQRIQISVRIKEISTGFPEVEPNK